MSLSAQVIAELIDAGLAGDALKAACRRIEDSQSVSNDARVTPGALRQRRYVEKQKASLSVSNDVSDAQNDEPTNKEVSKKVGKEEKKETDLSDGRQQASRRRNEYPPRFEAFWLAYPKDDGMSKAEALQPWLKLSAEDQEKAIAAIPAFKEWIKTQNVEYRTLHACRYLSKRRFDGFIEKAAAMEAAAQQHSAKIYVQYGSDAGDAWVGFYKAQGKIAPRDGKGGWWFDSEYPVSHETTPAMRKTA